MNFDYGKRVPGELQQQAHNYWGGPRRNTEESECGRGTHGLKLNALKEDIMSPRKRRKESIGSYFTWDSPGELS